MKSKKATFIYSIFAFTVVLLFCTTILQPFIEKKAIVFLDEVFSFDLIISKLLYIGVILLLIIPFTLNLFRRKYFQERASIISCILLLTYLSYRYIIPHSAWNFVHLHNKIMYLDVLYLFPFFYFIHALCVYLGYLPKKLETFFVKEIEIKKAMTNSPDAPIAKPAEDKLGYNLHSTKLLDRIIKGQEYYIDRAYNIGLIGQWGQGKTSFLNLMKYAVNQDKTSPFYQKAIIVEFNPWFCSNKEQIMVDFMCQIKKTLSPYNPDIDHNIDQYIDVLSQMGINWFSKLARLLYSPTSESIQESFKFLNESIAAIEKPVIVLLDDVDRLLSKEIFTVLQLIRNTANFKNTVFIVPYDEAYITSTLENGAVDRSKEYLKKIFTLSYHLPGIMEDHLWMVNSKLIKETLLTDDEESRFVDLFLEDIMQPISIRDAKRLAQNVVFAEALLLDENKSAFFLYDLLLVEYLKMNNYKLFTHVFQDSEDLFGSFGYRQTLNLNRTKNIFSKEEYTEDEFIDKKILPFSDNDILLANKSAQILRLIFDDPNIANAHKYDHPYRLRTRYVFNHYYTRTLPEDIIFRSDFEQARNGNMENLKKSLVKWNNPETIFILSKMLENVIFKDEIDGINILNAACVLYPQSITKSFHDLLNNKSIIVLTGFNIINYTYDRSIGSLHRKVFRCFLEDISYNENFEKRFALTFYFVDYLDRLYVSYEENGNIIENKKNVFNDLYLEYLEVYLKNKKDFQNFNTDFIFCLDKVYSTEYRDIAIRQLLDFIKNHLKSFVGQITSFRLLIDIFGIHQLFSIDSKYQSVNKNMYLYYYLEFLEGQPEETKKADWFIKHIEMVKQNSVDIEQEENKTE